MHRYIRGFNETYVRFLGICLYLITWSVFWPGGHVIKRTVTTFFIFSLFGGFALVIGRVISSYILSQRFNNERFLIEIMGNFQDITSSLIFYIINCASACAIAIVPCVYLYQARRLPTSFMASYSLAVFLISAICAAFYINFVRLTLPLGALSIYIIVLPFICTIFPIWFAYGVYRIYWLAKQ